MNSLVGLGEIRRAGNCGAYIWLVNESGHRAEEGSVKKDALDEFLGLLSCLVSHVVHQYMSIKSF